MNVFFSPRFRLGWILVIIGLVNALFWTGFRWVHENQFNKAQITLDYDDTRLMADAYGVSQLDLLKKFHEAGARSLALFDQSLANLSGNGRITILSRDESERLFPKAAWKSLPPAYRQIIVSPDGELLANIRPKLESQSGAIKPRPIILAQGGRNESITMGIAIPNSRQLVNDALLGFDPQHLALAKSAGLAVTARLPNPLNLTPDRLRTMLDDAQHSGAKVILMADDEVLGYQTLISLAAREMRERGLIFSNIEFSKQRGSEEFAKSTEGLICRVHSVSGDEAAKAKPEMIVDRYVRAARERDIRVLYIRLLKQTRGELPKVKAGEDNDGAQLVETSFEQNLKLIKSIRDELESPTPLVGPLRTSLHMGLAQPFGHYPEANLNAALGHTGGFIARYLMLFLSGLGTVGLTLLLLNLFFDLSPGARNLWFFIGLVIVAGLSLSAGMGAKLMSLQAGWTCSTVAILWGGLPLVWDSTNKLEGEPTPARVTLFGLKLLVKTTLLTLIGGFFVVTFLNNWKYMSKADEFLGEKATQFLPLLILPIAFAGELFPHRVEQGGAAAGRERGSQRARNALAQPFNVQVAVVSLFVLAAGYLWMARFGNESGMEISSTELKMRALLEKVFITRPRTKEIFMGHPAFFLCIYFLLRKRKPVAFLFFIAAIIGQTDALNSMCHIHTPVFYCIWRTVTGIFIGTIVGFFGLAVVHKFAGKISGGKKLNGSAPPDAKLNLENAAAS